MVIIGEKINGAIPKIGEAIAMRDEANISGLAKKQEEAGADYIDVCAGSNPEIEFDTLCWLIDVVQNVSTKPICIDSPDPNILARVFLRTKQPGIINSISGERNKCEILLPILRDNPEWQVMALCCDNTGIATTIDEKVCIASRLIERAAAYGVAPERIHIDPLVLSIAAVNDSALQFCAAMKQIKQKYPTVRLAAALSNVSFGMPARSLVNCNFLTMAMLSGLDTVIADPTNRAVISNIFATEALMGRDHCCRSFNKAYRNGNIS